MLASSLLSFLAAILTLIAFAIDIALYALFKSEMQDFIANASTTTAPGSSSVQSNINHILMYSYLLYFSKYRLCSTVPDIHTPRFLVDFRLPHPPPTCRMHSMFW